MIIELIDADYYANTYCLYDKTGKPIAIREVVINGRDKGSHYYPLISKSRNEVKRLFDKARGIKGA
jgi:hypothetical protein